MKNLILLSFCTLLISFSSFSQDAGKKTYEAIESCESCKEIVLIAGTVEKKYAGVWFESMEFKDGFLTFTKGANTHRWNLNNVVFIDQNPSYTRIYLEQAR